MSSNTKQRIIISIVVVVAIVFWVVVCWKPIIKPTAAVEPIGISFSVAESDNEYVVEYDIDKLVEDSNGIDELMDSIWAAQQNCREEDEAAFARVIKELEDWKVQDKRVQQLMRERRETKESFEKVMAIVADTSTL